MRCPFCAAENIQGNDTCSNCGSELAGLDLPAAQRGPGGRLLSDRVGDMKLGEPIVLRPDSTVREALVKMSQAHCGCVFIERDGEIVGAFNERDVLSRVLRRDRDPDSTELSEVMVPVTVKLHPDDPPAFAVHCMVSRGLRHLPVVAEGAMVGFISVRTILGYLNDELIGSS